MLLLASLLMLSVFTESNSTFSCAWCLTFNSDDFLDEFFLYTFSSIESSTLALPFLLDRFCFILVFYLILSNFWYCWYR